MVPQSRARQFVMDTPSRYLIRVVGELDKSWLGFFDTLSIVVCTGAAPYTISTVCTHQADQAAVMGLLNSLYDFGYPIVSFEKYQ